MEKIYRQGDILVSATDKTEGEVIAKNSHVLAEGETTGHKHILSGIGAVFKKDKDGKITVSLPKGGKLKHEEHAEIKLPKGNYAIVRQREFTPTEAVRQVAD